VRLAARGGILAVRLGYSHRRKVGPERAHTRIRRRRTAAVLDVGTSGASGAPPAAAACVPAARTPRCPSPPDLLRAIAAAAMDALRSRLRAASASLPSFPAAQARPPRAAPPSRLVALSARTHLVLAGDGGLHVVRAGGSAGAGRGRSGPLRLSAPLPGGAHTLVVGHGGGVRVAVVAPAGVAVVAVDAAAGAGAVGQVGRGVFETRPGLRVVCAAWHPRAEDYLMVLTSDGSLRLYDVAAGGDVDGERMRLRVVTTGDAPVWFAFGRAGGWDALAVYVLTEAGAVYVASPVAPVGTRVSREHWCAMRAEAEAVLEQYQQQRTPAAAAAARRESNVLVEEISGLAVSSTGGRPHAKAPTAGLTATTGTTWTTATAATTAARTTPRRRLQFGLLNDEDDGEGEEGKEAAKEEDGDADECGAARQRQNTSVSSQAGLGREDERDATWAVRQARLQLRFLERAFEQTSGGDMLMLREFKPAPLLFQGPLYVERDDVDGAAVEGAVFTSLTVLDGGPDVPPVLLRCSNSGHLSVLIGMEAVEGQWYISEDRFGTTGDHVLAASDEYARSASIVAPSLLCLEHVEFPTREPVALHPVRGKTDFDVLFARCGSAVYSVRLTFVSVMRDPDALRSTLGSVVAPLLTTTRLGSSGRTGSSLIAGLAPLFQKELGPLAVALTGDNSLEATAPLRWLADTDDACFPDSLIAGAGSDDGADGCAASAPTGRGQGGVARDVADALAAVQSGRDVQTWAVGAGSVGSVRDASSISDVLTCLETRVAAYTGADGGLAGVGDRLKSLGVLIPAWADEVSARSRGADRGIALVRGEFEARWTESDSLAVKLRRAAEMNENLRRRVNTLRQIHDARQSALSHAEVARHARLRERRRNVVAMRRKIEEISAAVRARAAAATDEAASTPRLPDGNAMRSPARRNAIGSLSGSPLLSRRASCAYGTGTGHSGDRGGLSRDGGGLGAAQLQRVKEELVQQSASILAATERSQALWEKFATV
jgi:hypothetical protein